MAQAQSLRGIRTAPPYSPVSYAGSWKALSTLQAPFPSLHHISPYLQGTATPSLITATGTKCGDSLWRPPWPWRLTRAGCSRARLLACWLSGFFPSWAMWFSPAWRLQPGFHPAVFPKTREAEYDKWWYRERKGPQRFRSWSSPDWPEII